MNVKSDALRGEPFIAFSKAAGIFVFLIGLSGLIGWTFDIAVLKSILPQWVAMKANTALCFLLSGLSLGLIHKNHRAFDLIQKMAAVFVALVGALTLIEYVFGQDFGIDQWFLKKPETAVGTFISDRMSPLTALNFLLIGLALLTYRIKSNQTLFAQNLALIAGMISLFSLLEYLYGAEHVPFTRMALQSAITFIVFSLGILCAQFDRGVIGILIQARMGSLLVRQLLPVVLLVPIILGWLRLVGQQKGFYGTEFGLALMTLVSVVIFVAFVFFAALKLNRADTARTAAEQSLRDQEKQYRTLTESLPEIVWTANADGTLDYYNQRWFDYTGMTLEQTKGWGWTPVIHPDDLQPCLTRWNHSLKSGEDHEIEVRFKRANDGSYRWHLSRATPMRNDEGRILKWFGTCTDIDDRKQMETQLQTLNETLEERVKQRTKALETANSELKISKSNLSRAQSIAHLGGWIWDLQKDTVWCSDETLHILGVSAEKASLTSKQFFQFIHSDEQDKLQDSIKALKTGKPSFSETYTLVSQDGISHSVYLEAKITQKSAHYPTEVSGILQDISELKNLERQLEQARKMETIGQLTGGLAHDFNNLLMVISGNLELLLPSFKEGNSEYRHVQSAIKATERGSDLTKRLLAFARKQTLHPKLTYPQEIIPSVVKLLKPTLGEAIEIAVHIPENVWPIYIDASQFENAIVNLAVNAKDAMARKGKLSIDINNVTLDKAIATANYNVEPGDYIKISITDTGCGMSADTLNRVFEPFFTTKEVGKGTGLGLSMVYGFIKQSKGHITIYSELQHGTTIHLYLPRARAEQQEKIPETLAAPQLNHQQGSEMILVVEDETSVRELTVEYLRGLGYQVLEAENGPLAVNLLQKNPEINLLFSDVVMPGGLSGPDLAKQALALYPNLKILLASGYPKNALSEHAWLEKEAEVMAKPYKMHELAFKVRQLLDA